MPEQAIVGYERVPDGDACKLCNLAAGQRYRKPNLMPIHNRCGCGVRPLVEADMFNPKRGEACELRDAKELDPNSWPVANEWVPVKGPIRGTLVKKNDTMVMLNAGTAKAPRWVKGTRLDVRKPTAASSRAALKKIEAVDTRSLPKITGALRGDAVRQALKQPKALFSAAERKATRAYTGGNKGTFGKGGLAGNMNKALRKGTSTARYDEVIGPLDAAFERVKPLTKPAVVYRGVRVSGMDSIRVGGVVEDAGYMSTSSARSVVEGFSEFDGAIFEITLPKGMKALDINEAAGSAYGFEREVLLPRGTRLLIESITPNPKNPLQRIIKARVIL